MAYILSFGVIFIVLIIYLIIATVNESKEIKAIKSANEKQYCYLSCWGDDNSTLFVKSRNADLSNLLAFKPYKIKKYNEVPEEYIYTSATVGRITTGGITKVGGYIDGKELNTGKYEFLLRVLELNKNNVEVRRYKPIEKIELSPELLEEAKKSSISSYIEGKYIVVVDPVALPSNLKHMSKIDAVNAFSAYQSAGYPSKEKCQRIYDWLCDKDTTGEKCSESYDTSELGSHVLTVVLSFIFNFLATLMIGLFNPIAATVAFSIITLISLWKIIKPLLHYVKHKITSGIIIQSLILIICLGVNIAAGYVAIEYSYEGDYSDHSCYIAFCDEDADGVVKNGMGTKKYYCKEHFDEYIKNKS